MLTTTVTLEGNLATDPELCFTPAGEQLAELRVLVNARRQNDAGEWEDTEPTRHRVTCFGILAENVTESLRTGDRVIVVGRTAPGKLRRTTRSRGRRTTSPTSRNTRGRPSRADPTLGPWAGTPRPGGTPSARQSADRPVGRLGHH